MEVLGLWSRSQEAHGLTMVVGLGPGGCLTVGLVIVGNMNIVGIGE